MYLVYERYGSVGNDSGCDSGCDPLPQHCKEL